MLSLRAASASSSVLFACLYLFIMPSVSESPFPCKCGQIAYDFSNDVISILYNGTTRNSLRRAKVSTEDELIDDDNRIDHDEGYCSG